MRAILASLALLGLAGCDERDLPVSDPAGPNEAAVEAVLENEQEVLAAGIENEGDADTANDSADVDTDATAYGCTDGTKVYALYGNDDGTVRLTVGGRTLALLGVTAASGNKFKSEAGLAPGKSVTWWTKGDEAMLIQAPHGAPDGSPRETIVTCTAQG